jgi:hypothetical protein
MSFQIMTHRQIVSYYDENGEWLDGDHRVISDLGYDVKTYVPEPPDGPSHNGWAIAEIRRTDAREPNCWPIGNFLGEHAWLSGRYESPVNNEVWETSIRLVGAWTEADRAYVFRKVCER